MVWLFPVQPQPLVNSMTNAPDSHGNDTHISALLPLQGWRYPHHPHTHSSRVMKYVTACLFCIFILFLYSQTYINKITYMSFCLCCCIYGVLKIRRCAEPVRSRGWKPVRPSYIANTLPIHTQCTKNKVKGLMVGGRMWSKKGRQREWRNRERQMVVWMVKKDGEAQR